MATPVGHAGFQGRVALGARSEAVRLPYKFEIRSTKFETNSNLRMTRLRQGYGATGPNDHNGIPFQFSYSRRGASTAFEDQAVSVKRTWDASASLDASFTEWDNLNPHFCRTRIEATLCFATPA